jgi:hypothetical protein
VRRPHDRRSPKRGLRSSIATPTVPHPIAAAAVGRMLASLPWEHLRPAPGHPDRRIKISGAPAPHQSDTNPAPSRPLGEEPQ